MKHNIHKAVVIGSGTMGAAIAAHLANIGVPVTLLEIVAKDSPDKNKIVREGWERCIKAWQPHPRRPRAVQPPKKEQENVRSSDKKRAASQASPNTRCVRGPPSHRCAARGFLEAGNGSS